jgi:Hyaluronidase protein (HylP)
LPRKLNRNTNETNLTEQEVELTEAVAVTVSSGVAISARSTSTTPRDHVAVFHLAADGGTNNAALNVVSANTAFSACEVSGHETGHGTLKISHVNAGPDPASDANAAAISIDLQAGEAGGTAAQGIFLKSTTGGTSGKILNFVDSTGVTIFALLADGSLLLRALPDPPAGTNAGLKLCNVSGTLGVVDATGAFTPLT